MEKHLIGIKGAKATRHNAGKLEWTLVDFKALEPMVEALMFGAKKYGADNWKKGLMTRSICDSLLRHISDYLNGADIDEESGLPHIGHILANAMFLSHMDSRGDLFDDRPSEVLEQ